MQQQPSDSDKGVTAKAASADISGRSATPNKTRRLRQNDVDASVQVEVARVNAILSNIGAWEYRQNINLPDEIKALETFINNSLKIAEAFTFSQRIETLKIEDQQKMEQLRNKYCEITHKITTDITSNVSKFLDERIQMEQNSIKYVKDKLYRDIADIRLSNEQFRIHCDIEANAKVAESCRIFQDDLQIISNHNTDVLTAEAVDLRKRLRAFEVQAEILQKKVMSLEREMASNFSLMSTYKIAYDAAMSKKKKKRGNSSPTPELQHANIISDGSLLTTQGAQSQSLMHKSSNTDKVTFADVSVQWEINPFNESNNNTLDNASAMNDSMFMTFTSANAATSNVPTESAFQEVKEALQQQHAAELTLKDDEIASLKLKIATSIEESVNLKSTIENLEGEVSSQKNRISEIINEKVLEIDKINNNFTTEIVTLTAKIADLNLNIEDLKNENSGQKISLTDMQKEIVSLKEDNRKLNVKIEHDAELEKIRKVQQNENDKAGQSALSEKAREVEQIYLNMMEKERLADLRLKKEEEDREREKLMYLTMLDEERQQRKESELELIAERESLLNQREALLQENNDVTEKMEFYRVESEKHSKMSDALEQDNDKLLADNDRLSDELKSLDSEKRNLLLDNNELRSIRVTLETEMVALNAKLNDLSSTVSELTIISENSKLVVEQVDALNQVNFDEERINEYLATIESLEDSQSQLQRQNKQMSERIAKLEEEKQAQDHSPIRTNASLELSSVGNSLFDMFSQGGKSTNKDGDKIQSANKSKTNKKNKNHPKNEEVVTEELRPKSPTKYLKEEYNAISAPYYTDKIQDLLYEAEEFLKENKALNGKNLLNVLTKDFEAVQSKFGELIELNKRLHFNGNKLREQNEFLNEKLRVKTEKLLFETKLNELKLMEKSVLLTLLTEEVTSLRQAVVLDAQLSALNNDRSHAVSYNRQSKNNNSIDNNSGSSDDDNKRISFSSSLPILNISQNFKRPSTSNAERDLVDEKITFAIRPRSFSRGLEQSGLEKASLDDEIDDDILFDTRARLSGMMSRSLGSPDSRPSSRDLNARGRGERMPARLDSMAGGIRNDPRLFELANIRGKIVEMLANSEKKNSVPLTLKALDTKKAIEKKENLKSREVPLSQSHNNETVSKFKR